MGRGEGESRTQNSLGDKKHEARGLKVKLVSGDESSLTQKHGQNHTHTGAAAHLGLSACRPSSNHA